jgi:hypothetical protein
MWRGWGSGEGRGGKQGSRGEKCSRFDSLGTHLFICVWCVRESLRVSACACTPRTCLLSWCLNSVESKRCECCFLFVRVGVSCTWHDCAYDICVHTQLTHSHAHIHTVRYAIFELIQMPIYVSSCHAYVLAYLCVCVCVCVCVCLCVYVYICAGGMQVRGRNRENKSL